MIRNFPKQFAGFVTMLLINDQEYARPTFLNRPFAQKASKLNIWCSFQAQTWTVWNIVHVFLGHAENWF